MVDQNRHKEITERILKVAFEVHRILKNGFPEIIYHRAMKIESHLQGLNFISEYEMEIFYKQHKIGFRKADLFYESLIPVELKAIAEMGNSEIAQAINHLEAINLEIGLLLNFGAKSLQYRRLFNTKYGS